MGVCAARCNELVEDIEVTQARKLRPLLFDLEREFEESAGADKLLSLEELTELWKRSAVKRAGKITDEEAALIEESARATFAQMDADESGSVSRAEFVAYSMGGIEDHGALRAVRSRLNAELKKNPGKLQELVELFRSWDRHGDGFVMPEELDQHLRELVELSGNSSHSMWGCCGGGGKKGATVRSLELASQVGEELKTVGVDRDGKVDLWETVAWALGRRKTPVELLVYDISKGAAKWLGPLLPAGAKVEALHTSVLVFGSEYWYGGSVFRSSPPCKEHFGPPLQRSTSPPTLKLEPSEAHKGLQVVRMGYTLATHEEFLRFVREKLADRYTGVEKYDLLTQSCDHFSDEALRFLLGRGVPAQVLELQQLALTDTVRSLRPYLNRFLGGFSQETGAGDLLQDGSVKAGPSEVDPSAVLGKEGSFAVLEGVPDVEGQVVAALLKEEGGLLDIRFFDPAAGKLATKSGVPASAVTKRLDA